MINAILFFMVLGMGLLLFFIWLLSGGALGPLMSSKLFNRYILLKLQEGKAILKTGPAKEGAIDTKDGPFLLTPKSTVDFYGRRLGVAYSGLSAVLPTGLISICAELKKKGIKDFDAMLELEPKLVAELEKLEKDRKKDPEGKAYLSNLLADIVGVKDFFLYSVSGAHIDNYTTSMVNAKMGKRQKQTVMYLIGAAIAVLIIIIAAMMWMNQSKCPDCGAITQQCMTMLGTARTAAASNTTVIRQSIV